MRRARSTLGSNSATDLLTQAESGILLLESVPLSGGHIPANGAIAPAEILDPLALYSSDLLSKTAGLRERLAAIMSIRLSSANLAGINAETKSAISDAWLGADIGAEMANLTKYQIMMQAGTSALNNANHSAQSVLSLFK